MTERPDSTSDNGPLPGRRRRLFRAARLGFFLLLLALTACVGVYKYYTRSSRLTAMMESYLAQYTGAEATIDSASFSLTGPIVLRGVDIRVPGLEAGGHLLFVREVHIEHRHLALLRGDLDATRIIFHEATLYPTEFVDKDKFNFQFLEPEPRAGAEDQIGSVPEIQAQGIKVVFGLVRNGKYAVNQQVILDGQVLSLADRENAYRFSLDPPGSSPGPALVGDIDLGKGTTTARLEQVELDNPLMNILPTEMRLWWRTLEPTGKLKPITFSYDPQAGTHVTLTVDGIELTPPYTKRPLRMHVDKGEFVFANDRIEPELQGTIDRFRYRIHGYADDAFAANPQVDMWFVIDGELDPDPEFIESLDPILRKPIARQIEKFRPAGPFQAELHLTREADQSEFNWDADVRLLGMTGSYYQFAYPLSDVRGLIEFQMGQFGGKSLNQIRVSEMSGRGPSGAPVAVDGTVLNPGTKDETDDINIRCAALPVDDHLRAALQEDELEVIEAIMNRREHQRLIDEGLIGVDVPAGDADDAPPYFPLGGGFNVHARIQRIPRPDGGNPWINTITFTLDGQNLLCEGWPYPVTATGGTVIVRDDETSVAGVTVEGLTGARGAIAGQFKPLPGGPAKQLKPFLDIKAQSVPIDALLLSTLPRLDAQWIGELNIEGAAEGVARIEPDANGQVSHRVKVRVSDATAIPHKSRGGRCRLTDLDAEIDISPELVEVTRASARYGDSRLVLSCTVAGTNKTRTFDVKAKGTDMRFEDPLTDLLDPDDPDREQLQTLLDKYQPRGHYDISLEQTIEGDKTTHYELRVDPHRLSAVLNDYRVEMTEMAGGVRLTEELVELNSLHFKFPDGQATLAGRFTNEPDPDIDLTIDARCSSFNETTRAMLPEGARQAIEDLAFDGAYHLRDAQLKLRPRNVNRPTLSFSGYLDLTDASVDLGMPVDSMTATVGLSATQGPDWPWPRIEMRLDAVSLRIFDRKIAPLEVHMHSINRLGTTDFPEPEAYAAMSTIEQSRARNFRRLEIDHVLGDVYAGQVFGEATILLSERGRTRYTIDLALQEAAIEPFLEPNKETQWLKHIDEEWRERVGLDPTPNREPSDPTLPGVEQRVRGTLSISLAMEGIAALDSSRRGSGRIRIDRARLYEMPLTLSIVRVLNLSMPGTTTFDRASGWFSVDGNTVHLDDIRFTAPSLEMRGGGTIAWEDGAVDLLLYSRNPAGLKIAPFSAIWDRLKAELFTVKVAGTLREPQVSVTTMSTARRTWNDIFGETWP